MEYMRQVSVLLHRKLCGSLKTRPMQNDRFYCTGRQMQHTLLSMRQKSSADAVLAACVLHMYL